MKCTKPSVLVVLVPTLAVAVGVSRSAGSQGQGSNGEVALSVEGPRPLAEAAKLLELKLGVGVSYEDVPLVYSGDYARASDTSWGRKYGDDHKEFKTVNPISFIGGTLQIQFQIDPRTTKPIASASQKSALVLGLSRLRNDSLRPKIRNRFQWVRSRRPSRQKPTSELTRSVLAKDRHGPRVTEAQSCVACLARGDVQPDCADVGSALC